MEWDPSSSPARKIHQMAERQWPRTNGTARLDEISLANELRQEKRAQLIQDWQCMMHICMEEFEAVLETKSDENKDNLFIAFGRYRGRNMVTDLIDGNFLYVYKFEDDGGEVESIVPASPELADVAQTYFRENGANNNDAAKSYASEFLKEFLGYANNVLGYDEK